MARMRAGRIALALGASVSLQFAAAPAMIAPALAQEALLAQANNSGREIAGAVAGVTLTSVYDAEMPRDGVFDGYNQPGDGTAISDGFYIREGEPLKITVKWDAKRVPRSGEYFTYKVPEVVSYGEDKAINLVSKRGIVYGYATLTADGLLTVTFNDDAPRAGISYGTITMTPPVRYDAIQNVEQVEIALPGNDPVTVNFVPKPYAYEDGKEVTATGAITGSNVTWDVEIPKANRVMTNSVITLTPHSPTWSFDVAKLQPGTAINGYTVVSVEADKLVLSADRIEAGTAVNLTGIPGVINGESTEVTAGLNVQVGGDQAAIAGSTEADAFMVEPTEESTTSEEPTSSEESTTPVEPTEESTTPAEPTSSEESTTPVEPTPTESSTPTSGPEIIPTEPAEESTTYAEPTSSEESTTPVEPTEESTTPEVPATTPPVVPVEPTEESTTPVEPTPTEESSTPTSSPEVIPTEPAEESTTPVEPTPTEESTTPTSGPVIIPTEPSEVVTTESSTVAVPTTVESTTEITTTVEVPSTITTPVVTSEAVPTTVTSPSTVTTVAEESDVPTTSTTVTEVAIPTVTTVPVTEQSTLVTTVPSTAVDTSVVQTVSEVPSTAVATSTVVVTPTLTSTEPRPSETPVGPGVYRSTEGDTESPEVTVPRDESSKEVDEPIVDYSTSVEPEVKPSVEPVPTVSEPSEVVVPTFVIPDFPGDSPVVNPERAVEAFIGPDAPSPRELEANNNDRREESQEAPARIAEQSRPRVAIGGAAAAPAGLPFQRDLERALERNDSDSKPSDDDRPSADSHQADPGPQEVRHELRAAENASSMIPMVDIALNGLALLIILGGIGALINVRKS